MDRLCDKFLSGTRLAGDQHGRVRRRDAPDEAQHFFHLRRLGDDLGQVVLAACDLGAEARDCRP